jgi:hypothetical protein
MTIMKEKKKVSSKAPEVLDSFESWLARQPVKPVRAKAGYVSAQKDKESP